MLDGFIGSILTNILAWELIVSSHSSLERHRVVHMVNILLSPHAHVSYESVVVMALRAWHRTISVVLLDLFSHEEGHILVVNSEDYTRPILVDLLAYVLFDQLTG